MLSRFCRVDDLNACVALDHVLLEEEIGANAHETRDSISLAYFHTQVVLVYLQ